MSHQYVNVYEVDRNYGGPEEGGWWYDSGEPVASIQCDERQVEQVKTYLWTMYPQINAKRQRYSVNGGYDLEIHVEEHFAKPWPETRPHYE